LKLYLNLPQTTAIAAVRNLDHPSVEDLRSLPVSSGSRLIVVKIDSAFLEDPKDAVAVLRDQYGITQLDTVIANAGIGKDWSLVAQTDIAEVEDHFKINSVGPFALYLATRSLLLASENPKFVVLSTELGSIGLQGERKIQDVAYGMSKAAVNFFVGKLHHEEPKLTAFPIHPGSVSIAVKLGIVLMSLADGSKPALETPLQRPSV
jgi:norsolorinic acid ketoreductase